MINEKESSVSSLELNKRSDLHLVRKIWHIVAGLTGFYFYFSLVKDRNEMPLYLLLLSLGVFALEYGRLHNKKLNTLVIKVMAPFMRKSEVDHYSGFAFYSLGVSLSLFFFPEKYAILSALFLVFADPISSTVGVSFGKNHYLPNKSVEGSLACVLTCYIISTIYMYYYGVRGPELFLFSVLAGLVGAFSEALSVWIDDNLTIPVVSGLGMTILAYFIL
jgi:diacylglycerol kinase (CTP)